jgi:CDP-paratose 2-epimerase
MEFRGERERIVNVAGGVANGMSLRQLSAWCAARWGDHNVEARPEPRPFDLPWLVLDSARAENLWGWKPQIGVASILDEIAVHAEANPGWLERTAS